MFGELKKTEETGLIAAACARSPQPMRQYLANPDSTAFRRAPVKVTDTLVSLLMSADVIRPDATPSNYAKYEGWQVDINMNLPWPGKSYLIALEVYDRHGVSEPVSFPDTRIAAPVLNDAARLRHEWRKVFFGGRVPRQDLADVAGTDIYNVAWVGREHPTRGIQPTHEMVMWAMANDAGMETLGEAA
ncbi:hypothetical protein [Hoeflea alexandrii]|uniref:hypothetical protein n=1 Tax=Hoeflea alexandrii TaxID=288436 RepID=UPI0022AE9CCC|nr:hypothetical protein [Hoeflea alexandrii]MCZ4287242.1 hypothetical protein [Hoeflea alexandrii]